LIFIEESQFKLNKVSYTNDRYIDVSMFSSFLFHITSSESKTKSRVNKTLQAFAELQLNVATLAAKMRKQRALRSPPAKLVVMGIYCAICPAQSPQHHRTTEPLSPLTMQQQHQRRQPTCISVQLNTKHDIYTRGYSKSVSRDQHRF